MTAWYPIQNSFSGGEVSPRTVMRSDIALYRQAMMQMYNFIPTLQGPMQRAAGTQHFDSIGDAQPARVIPYLSVINEAAIVLLTEAAAKIYTSIADEGSLQRPRSVGGSVTAVSGFKQQIVQNGDFTENVASWNINPSNWVSLSDDSDSLGAGYGVRWVDLNRGSLQIASRKRTSQAFDVEVACSQVCNIDVPTDILTVDINLQYAKYYGNDATREGYDFHIKFGTTEGGSEIADIEITGEEGTIYDRTTHHAIAGGAYTGPVYISFELLVEWPPKNSNNPIFVIDHILAFAEADPIVGEVDLVTPYLADELDDIHFVQSPYGEKALVLTHPNHPPHRIYYDSNTTMYVSEPIPFTFPPDAWSVGNYPSTCTAYQGRLVLAGTPEQSETHWATENGLWSVFTEQPVTTPAPSDSLEWTATYRSPIQWVFGQKDMLTGTEVYEYATASNSGLLQAGDIDIRLHSTHGGAHVQPASFGEFIMYAADRGTRVRALQLNRDDEGWIAPDLTLLADHITRSGVRRMVRMRNPHQMCVCALGNGTIALLHQDNQAQITGWSRYDVGGEVRDVAVLPNSEGLDVLFMLVLRSLNGVKKLHLEAVVNFGQDFQWDYVTDGQNFIFDAPTSLISGLEHLEGLFVQVVGDKSYLGEYQVDGGTINLLRPEGGYFEVSSAVVGRQMLSRAVTMPAMADSVNGGATSKKRYSEIGVRLLNSSRPIINGDRIPDRDPLSPMDISQPLDQLSDHSVLGAGWDEYALITIEEDKPVACEIAGIFGKLASNSL